MNYQPEIRRKRTRSSSEDTLRSNKTRLSNQQQEEEPLNITCAICLEKLSDPHLLPDCCHRFCGGCIKESIAMGNMSCPSCRVRIPTKRHLRKDDLLEKLLFRLQRLEDENAYLKHRIEIKEQRVMEQGNFDEDENEKHDDFGGDKEHDDFGEDENEEHGATEAPKRFDKRFNDLKEYKSRYGHCNVPNAYNAHDNLGQWVIYIRSIKSGTKKNSGVYMLTNERVKKLEKIGFRWQASRTFEDRFNALKEYKLKHGHCNVPFAYKEHDNLGQWVQNIRKIKSGTKKNSGVYMLTNERVKKLEKIGFRWKMK